MGREGQVINALDTFLHSMGRPPAGQPPGRPAAHPPARPARPSARPPDRWLRGRLLGRREPNGLPVRDREQTNTSRSGQNRESGKPGLRNLVAMYIYMYIERYIYIYVCILELYTAGTGRNRNLHKTGKHRQKRESVGYRPDGLQVGRCNFGSPDVYIYIYMYMFVS